MCQNCKSSCLGVERQTALDASIAECQRVGINPETSGFIARHAWRGNTPQFTDEQRAALTRYNTAQSNVKALHDDYLFERAREDAHQRLERRNAGKRDYLQEYAVAFDANDDAAQAALLKIAEADPALDAAITALFATFDGVRTLCEHLEATRENH